jgi:hypothetical protein
MNFFDVLNNVLYNKKTDTKILYNGIEEFSPFMLNRWCSMYNNDICSLINVTTNRLHNVFEDKLTQYKLFLNVIPRLDRRRIQYIKKVKPEVVDDEQEMTSTLARELELSEKEINMYIQYEREHRSTSTD